MENCEPPPGTMKNHENEPGIMKNQPGTWYMEHGPCNDDDGDD